MRTFFYLQSDAMAHRKEGHAVKTSVTQIDEHFWSPHKAQVKCLVLDFQDCLCFDCKSVDEMCVRACPF